MELDHAEILAHLAAVLEARNAAEAQVEKQNQYAARVPLVKELRPAEPDHGPTAERIARAEAVIAYAESAERARVAIVERWATSSPLARAA